jgi:hypothetical protein
MIWNVQLFTLEDLDLPFISKNCLYTFIKYLPKMRFFVILYNLSIFLSSVAYHQIDHTFLLILRNQIQLFTYYTLPPNQCYFFSQVEKFKSPISLYMWKRLFLIKEGSICTYVLLKLFHSIIGLFSLYLVTIRFNI